MRTQTEVWRVRVVVTGSSGLLGRHVAAAFAAAGHDVLGIDLVAPAAPAWQHVSADLTQLGPTLQSIRRAEVVVHAAAVPRPTGRAAADVFSTNIAAMYNVLDAAEASGARRFVYASSFSVFGYPFFTLPVRPPALPVDEHHPIGAQDAYAVSKWLGEEMVDAAVRRGAFDAVSLRMPWIQTPESFLQNVGRRRATADAARDLWAYLDARDAGAAFVLAATCEIEGHLRVLISAEDTYMEEETEPLIRRVYPEVAIRQPLPGFRSVIDLDQARTTLGFVPRHGWRSYPEA